MDAKTNIFFHAPKELTTDAFLVWLLYFLDSEDVYKTQKQTFFDSIILKKADRGRPIGGIELKRQENNVDVLLTFRFEDDGERQMALFEDKTWSMPHSEQMARYRAIYPDCYRYFYYKLAYMNSQECKEVSNEHYDIIFVGEMASVLERMVDLHPLIKMYYEYITVAFLENINSLHEKLFKKHDYDVLWSADGQKYLCDCIVENMYEQGVPYLEIRNGTSFGRPWTQIDIARKGDGYCESLFWRVDIRSGRFYIRLKKYGEPSNDEVEYKMRRLEILRKEAADIVASMPALHPGKVTDRGTKESEVLIFFLEENDIDRLLELLPKISSRMIDVFKKID